jgi:radical SAM superfamily enzyme YgiQ (UPF0313 family)
MKVLLVNPPHSFSPENPLAGAGLSLPPLGLLSIAAFLRKEIPGITIKVIDWPAAKITPETFEREVAAFGPDAAGVSVYTGTFTASVFAAAAIKKTCPNCFVAAGGHHATARPAQCLEKGFDAVIVGEGERTFCELVKELSSEKTPAGLPGLVFRSGDAVTRPEPLDIDSLPFPARDLLDLSAYRPALFGYKRLPVTSMVTSRGCPYSCGFCSKEVFGSVYRAQSPARVLSEIKELVGKYGIKEITFQDDTFTADRARVLKLCSLIKESGLDLTWSCMTRVDLVDPELLTAMKSAGCFSIAFGIDGASDGSCGLMRKGFGFAQAKTAVAAARAAGIETRGYYILGYPGETLSSMIASLERMIGINTDHVFLAFAHPFFDTELYREAKKNGLLEVSDEELLDSHDNSEPLIKVPGVSSKELKSFYKLAYLKYYLRPLPLLRRLATPRGLADSFKAFLYFVRWY